MVFLYHCFKLIHYDHTQNLNRILIRKVILAIIEISNLNKKKTYLLFLFIKR